MIFYLVTDLPSDLPMCNAIAEPVSLKKIAAALELCDKSHLRHFPLLFEMVCFPGTPALCRYTSSRYLRHDYAFVGVQLSQLAHSGSCNIVFGCSQMPLYRPFLGRPLCSRSASLHELLHTRHRTCPGELHMSLVSTFDGAFSHMWGEY